MIEHGYLKLKLADHKCFMYTSLLEDSDPIWSIQKEIKLGMKEVEIITNDTCVHYPDPIFLVGVK